MSSSDQLYRLIKSLEPSEKRMFKLQMVKQKSNEAPSHYEALFDALNQWKKKPYLENEFLDRHANAGFTKNFAYEKHYLFQFLLRMMRGRSGTENPSIRFHEHAQDFYFLYQKGLTESAASAYQKMEEDAINSSCIEARLLLQPIYWNLHNQMEGGADSTWEKGQQWIHQLWLERKAYYLSVRMGELFSNAVLNDASAIETIVKESLQLLQDPELSLKGQKNLVNVLLNYYSIENRHNQSFEIAQSWVQKLDQAKKEEILNPMWMNSALHNLMESAACIGRWDTFQTALVRFRQFHFDQPMLAADHFVLQYTNEIRYRLGTNHHHDSNTLLESIDQNLNIHLSHATPFYVKLFQFQLARYHFFLKLYDECLSTIQQTWDDPVWKNRLGLSLIESRALEWMCHALAGNFSILDSALLSLKRLIKNHSDKTTWTKPMLICLESILKQGHVRHKNLQSIFEKWDTSLIPVNVRPGFDLIKAAVLQK